jgi:hypothetical protein
MEPTIRSVEYISKCAIALLMVTLNSNIEEIRLCQSVVDIITLASTLIDEDHVTCILTCVVFLGKW